MSNRYFQSFIHFSKALFLTVCISLFTLSDTFSQANSEPVQSNILQSQMDQMVEEKGIPGMVAAIISEEGLVTAWAAGVRKNGSDVAMTIHDQGHLGSCGKAMTAVMVATLVEEGRLSWTTTVAEAIPALKESIHSDYREVTLRELLAHTSGLPSDPKSWKAYLSKPIDEQRLLLTIEQLSKPAVHRRGIMNYSNLGYVIVGCMAEQITGKTWETLMQQRLFDVLDMPSAGFGAPGTPGKIDQPWGHKRNFLNRWRPSQSDYHETMGPAGLLHCNVEDWGKFLALQLNDQPAMLNRTLLDELIEPVDNLQYAGGWGLLKQEWAQGVLLAHQGSNERWFASVAVAPALNRAYVVVANACDFNTTPVLVNEIMRSLLRLDLN